VKPAEDAGAADRPVPAQVNLPPEARVAVTTPFAGTAVQVLVIQGQAVAKGQALAVVRAASRCSSAPNWRDPSRSGAGHGQCQPASQLSRAGVIAGGPRRRGRAALRAARHARANRRRWRWRRGRDGTVTLRAPRRDAATATVEPARPSAAALAPFVIENTSLRLDLQLPERLAAAARHGSAGAAGGGATVTADTFGGASLDPVTRSTAKASLASDGLVPGKGHRGDWRRIRRQRRGASQRSPDRRTGLRLRAQGNAFEAARCRRHRNRRAGGAVRRIRSGTGDDVVTELKSAGQ
jgi:cobalt-zinc-cadmium efflux system membrane fusion protein